MTPESDRTPVVSPFWMVAYLLATLVVGVAAAVLIYRADLGGHGSFWRLLPMLLVGELIIYLIMLIVPGERVVPPERALFGLGFGLAIRASMAFLSASAIRLSDPSLGQGAVMGGVYASYWLAALVQILLTVLYLWLIRGALEAERLKPPIERAKAQARLQQEEEESASEERRRRLLTALLEQREPQPAPPAEPEPMVAEPVPVEPEPEPEPPAVDRWAPSLPPLGPEEPPAEPEPSPEQPSFSLPPVAAAEPPAAPEQPDADDSAGLDPWERLRRRVAQPQPPEAPAAEEAVAEEAVAEEAVAEEAVAEEAVAEEAVAEEAVAEPVAPPGPPPDVQPVAQPTLTLDEIGDTASFGPVEEPAVEEPAVEEPAVEEPAVEEPAVEEPAVEEPAVVVAPAASALAGQVAEALQGLAPGHAPLVWEVPGQPLWAALRTSAAAGDGPGGPVRTLAEAAAAACEAARAGAPEVLVAMAGERLSGLAALPAGRGTAYLLVDLPQASNLGTATLSLKQARSLLADLDLPAEPLASTAAHAAAPFTGDLPPLAAAVLAAESRLQPFAGQGTVLVLPAAAEGGRVAAAAEALLAAWQALEPQTGRLLLTGSEGGLVVAQLAPGLSVGLVAGSPNEVAAHNVLLKKLVAALGPEAQ